MLLVLLTMLLVLRCEATPRRPHIVFILADDMGWNDVSYHGSPEIPTPHIDELVRYGVALHQYYVDLLCTPSRSALMTGRYALRNGLQHSVILAGERSGLPLGNTLLPQYLQRLGYQTHIVGKWHLGYYRKEFMPTRRGFDSFFGYGNGDIDYYDYTNNNDGLPKKNASDPVLNGVDLFNGTEPVKDFRGVYATHAFTNRAVELIRTHDPTKPLFLYLAQLAVHGSAGGGRVVQAPPEYVRRFPHLNDSNRRVFAGMVSALDDSVGAVIAALKAKGILQDSLIVFASDNGAELDHVLGGYGSNFPLRGKKFTLWEGGVRVPAVVWSPLLRPRVTSQLMHVTDWLPTLYAAAGGDPNDLEGPLDGVNQWPSLLYQSPPPRTDLLHNVDPITGLAAYRNGHMKLVRGGEPGQLNPQYGNDATRSNENEPNRIVCALPQDTQSCDPRVKPCLFNITADPCEQRDLADQYPEVVRSMLSTISKFEAEALPPQSKEVDPLADPLCHGFSYVPWMEPEYFSEDCFYYH